jgi:carbonic anhydrase
MKTNLNNMGKFNLSKFLCLVIILITSCEKDVLIVRQSGHFEYEHPDEWANQGYAECAGKVGTPIDIDNSKTLKVALPSPTFKYQIFPMRIVDNGHTIQVNASGAGSLEYNSTQFTFKQFHHHHQSEHTLNGNNFPLEFHFVHVDEATNNLLVLGVWVKPGAANSFLDKVILSFPIEKFTEFATNFSVDVLSILPANKKYYRYTGSLTTPPCSQGVTWIMLQEPIEASQAQINAFKARYEVNNRPVQPLNNRILLESL